jgi:hypothetical protein
MRSNIGVYHVCNLYNTLPFHILSCSSAVNLISLRHRSKIAANSNSIYYTIRNFIALRYEIASFSAPNISVYCPGFKSIDGVNVNHTS